MIDYLFSFFWTGDVVNWVQLVLISVVIGFVMGLVTVR